MIKKTLLFTALTLPFATYANFSPIMDSELNSEFNDPMIEERMEDNWENDLLEDELMEEQRMEELEEERIDYNDRTRTDRERKALNTSSNASDDQ